MKLRSLMLAALMLFSGAALAEEPAYGNPIAYTTNSKGGMLIITDKEDLKLCPPKMYIAVAKNSREDTEGMFGCWFAMADEDSGRMYVIIAWQPTNDIQTIPATQFHRIEDENVSHIPTFQL